MIKVAVLGGGLVGTPMALDLNKDENILVKLADINEDHLSRARSEGIDCYQMDILEEGQLEDFVKDVQYVINALPGEIGYQSLKRAVLAGKSGVDIAFYPEDFSELQELAIEKGVCWVVDMGVAPGMSHLLSAFGTTQLDETDDIKIYVGGLPKDTNSYWQYKAPFSPSDVLEEYTRPARFIRNGEEISMPALSENELLNFPVVGELEAFNSDGLRSLMKSLNVENMIEKTLRYPGYVDKINVLKETGLFSQIEKDVKGVKVKPLDMTSQLLFSQWKLGEEENEEKKTIIYDLYDEYCPSTRIHSMARTTGYAATSVLTCMIDGLFCLPGVHLAFHENLVTEILNRLKHKGVVYQKSMQ